MPEIKCVRNNLKRRDGTPWPYGTVISHVVDRIREASEAGGRLILSGEEVRALDWAVIREEGGVSNVESFRCGSFAQIGESDPNG